MNRLLWLVIFLPAIARSNAIVVATLGNTVDASQYISSINNQPSISTAANPNSLIAYNFIVHSSLLTPGKVERKAVNNTATFAPIYLVGTDPLSVTWLKQHAEKLQQLHAKGYLVNCANQQDYESFVGNTGLHLPPVNGDSVANKFTLTHYPLLISQHWIEQ